MKFYKFAEVTATNGEIFRTEKIDLVNNILFKHILLKTKDNIKKMYEEFWNGEIKVTNVKFKNN
jgi:hypothetical protein